jgi:hypothetical protein
LAQRPAYDLVYGIVSAYVLPQAKEFRRCPIDFEEARGVDSSCLFEQSLGLTEPLRQFCKNVNGHPQ